MWDVVYTQCHTNILSAHFISWLMVIVFVTNVSDLDLLTVTDVDFSFPHLSYCILSDFV